MNIARFDQLTALRRDSISITEEAEALCLISQQRSLTQTEQKRVHELKIKAKELAETAINQDLFDRERLKQFLRIIINQLSNF